MKNKSKYVNFTLLELLIVIAIIAILLSILLPSLDKSRSIAQSAVCASNLSQTSIGLSLYLKDTRSLYPHGRKKPEEYSWEDYISNYLGSNLTDTEKGLTKLPIDKKIPILICPVEDYSGLNQATITNFAARSYRANNYLRNDEFGIFSEGDKRSKMLMEIGTPSSAFLVSDGVSNSYQGEASKYGAINNGSINRLNDYTHYSNRKNVLFVDGRVTFMLNSLFFPRSKYFKIVE